MKSNPNFDDLVDYLISTIGSLPDQRAGNNMKYTMKDIALSAFSVFFTQSPSFLAFQKSMRDLKGKDNAESFFKVKNIPTDNHIRERLDKIDPRFFFPVFKIIFNSLEQTGILDSYRSFNHNLLVALDGTWYHDSKTIHCDKCLRINHKDGTTTFYHSAITPVIVKPGNDKVISLPPEFITPQDGHNKQDCENAAAKRWINQNGSEYASLGMTVLGDDLYCKHPLCVLFLEQGFDFILTCKPDSHKALYEWLNAFEEGVNVFSFTKKNWNGKFNEFHTFSYANGLPLRDSEDTLWVNWCELTITDENQKILYKNAFATNFEINQGNVEQIVADGRARFKVENENNNILKTKGYNLEHNFGHGKEYLSMLLMTFNLLAFLFHTVLEYCDSKYRLLRFKLPSRKTFFNDIRTLTRYLYFESWGQMLEFMLKGLEQRHRIKPP